MSATRTSRGWLSPSEKLKLSAKLREVWASNPALTMPEIAALTNAPMNVVENVRKRLVLAGVLAAAKSGPKSQPR